jgi:subfamily B ATP-binding cassette protein HlyB/CyaB
VVNDGDDEYVLATLGPGEIFGEKACLMRQEQPASVVAEGDTVLLVIPEKSAHFILERNAKFREVIEERVRFFERELQRQKRLAERRKRPVILDLASTAEGRREDHQALRLGRAGRGNGLRRRLPGDAVPPLRHQHDPRQAARAGERDHAGRDPGQPGARRRALGFGARGVQCTFDALLGFELPFIVHWEGYHYVIVYGVSPTRCGWRTRPWASAR